MLDWELREFFLASSSGKISEFFNTRQRFWSMADASMMIMMTKMVIQKCGNKSSRIRCCEIFKPCGDKNNKTLESTRDVQQWGKRNPGDRQIVSKDANLEVESKRRRRRRRHVYVGSCTSIRLASSSSTKVRRALKSSSSSSERNM